MPVGTVRARPHRARRPAASGQKHVQVKGLVTAGVGDRTGHSGRRAGQGSGCSAQITFPPGVYRVPQRSVSCATRNRPRPPSSVIAAYRR